MREGSNATFAVAIYGTEPLHYQWQFNGSAAADATSATFTLTNVQAAQLGDYTVVVTNSYGAVTSGGYRSGRRPNRNWRNSGGAN